MGFAGQVVILMTSTIRPSGCDEGTARRRRREYEEALESWLLTPDPRIGGIVYCDNSPQGAEDGPAEDLSWVGRAAERTGSRRPVEVLACADSRIPSGMHYGFAELGIIDHALVSSHLLGRATHFAKATGRLRFPDFTRLLDRLPPDFDACLDYRQAYRGERRIWTMHRARTQLMLFRTDFYRQSLYQQRGRMLEHKISHIEEFIPGLIVPRRPEATRVMFRWPVACDPSGVSGNGLRYESRRRRLHNLAAGIARRWMSWLWL